MKTPVFAALTLLLVPSIALAQQGRGMYRPATWAAHQMHSHHLSSMHHADVLNSYSEHLESIPKEALQAQVKLIQRDAAASRKSLNSMPADQLTGDAADKVKALKKTHAQTIKSAKAITEELGKDDVDYSVVSKHVKQMSSSLRAGEGHIHSSYQLWKMSPVHRRLHPGT